MPLSEINGIAVSSISKLDGISTVATVDGITYSSGFTPTVLLSYGFDDQTVLSGSTPGPWNPTLTHSAWANGSVAVSGSQWAPTGTPTNTNVVGKNSGAWRCDSNATGSGNTGPAVLFLLLLMARRTSHQPNTSTVRRRNSWLRLIVYGTPGFSPAQIRTGQNTSLNLRFWLHGYGDSIDTLSVYVMMRRLLTRRTLFCTPPIRHRILELRIQGQQLLPLLQGRNTLGLLPRRIPTVINPTLHGFSQPLTCMQFETKTRCITFTSLWLLSLESRTTGLEATLVLTK